MDAWLAAAIFVIAYVLIAVEPFDRTLIALLAGLLVIVLGIVDQHDAFAAIDLNVIFLLAGMMVIAAALAKTGFFEWVAVRSVRLSRGNPLRLLLLLAAATGIMSAFLDNVTTIVLMTPITLVVARRLGVSPIPYIISQVLASNIGGTATLIGDPPNILIGSAARLSFADFLVNLAPVTVVIFAVYLVFIGFVFRRQLEVPSDKREAAVEATAEATITDRPLLAKVLVVVALTLIGFLLHSTLGLEAATVALLGATLVLLIGRLDPPEMLAEVEWSTLFFFIGLFVLVEAVVEVGIVGGVAQMIADASGGQAGVASIGMMWFSAIASAIVDNIPYTATAIPIVNHLIEGGLPSDALWWSLALGACLGGNLTVVGASANVVAANLSARAGHPIRFFHFMRYGAPVVAGSLLIATVYVWLRYLA